MGDLDRHPRTPVARRASAPLLALLVVLGVGSGCLGSGASSPGRQSPSDRAADAVPRVPTPNVVVVLTDDQDPASLSVMRHVREDLATAGTTFAEAFVSVPECCPSRASLLTGQYAHNHGVTSNQPPNGGFDGFRDRATLPVWLQDVGYRTGYVGKYLNGYGWEALGNDPTYVPPGWSYWAALTRGIPYQMYDYSINQNGRVEPYGSEPGDYQTDVLADKADEFLRASANRGPFFLEVAPTAPHDEGVLEGTDAHRNPRPAPRDEGALDDLALPRDPSFDEGDISDKPRFVRNDPRLSPGEVADLAGLYRSRQESLLAVDDLVHRLVTTLRRTGELDETVFVFTSDNGYLLGQHRRVGKERVYEESAGVPLIVRGPGFATDATVDRPVSNVDITATIVRQSGARPAAPLDGVPLERALSGDRTPILIEMLTDRAFAAIRTPRYLLAEYDRGGTEFYDLQRDPYELENLDRDPAARGVRQRLAKALARLRDCAGVTCR